MFLGGKYLLYTAGPTHLLICDNTFFLISLFKMRHVIFSLNEYVMLCYVIVVINRRLHCEIYIIRVTLGPLYRFGPLAPRHCRGCRWLVTPLGQDHHYRPLPTLKCYNLHTLTIVIITKYICIYFYFQIISFEKVFLCFLR